MNIKIKSFILTLFICISFYVPTYAVSNSAVNSELGEIAQSQIITTYTENEDGLEEITYSNLDGFIKYVKENLYISDYDLAIYIMDYTNMYYDENMSDSLILETLTFSETTISNEIIYISEDGAQRSIALQDITPLSDWTSPDGYLKITTTSSKQAVSGETRYLLTGTATWLKSPAICSSDVFVLTSDATFDDSYAENAYFSQHEYCITHKHALDRYAGVTKSNPYGDGVELEYRAGTPGLCFSFKYLCDKDPYSYVNDPSQDRFTAYIRYRVIPKTAGGTYQAQASYCHKTAGGKIDWSLGLSGIQPSFKILGTKVDYFARPITLR